MGIGAWWPHHDEGRQLRKDLSPWLAVRLTPEDSPWAFRADGESHRVISGLEVHAVPTGLKFLLPPHMNGDPGKHLVLAPVLTDNQGNGHALAKLHSCRFPLASEELKARAMTAKVQWAPRETNEEADALSNLQFAGSSAECPRRRVDPRHSLAHFRSSSPVERRIRDSGQGRPGTPRSIEEVLEQGETQEARRTSAL